MKKLIKYKVLDNLPAIWVALVFLLGVLLITGNTNANSHDKDTGFPDGMLTTVPVPVYCGNSFELLTTTMETFGMKYVASGDVRTGGASTGDLIGTTSFWYNENAKTGIFFMTTSGNGITCMLTYGLNFKFDEEMMLEIINEEIK